MWLPRLDFFWPRDGSKMRRFFLSEFPLRSLNISLRQAEFSPINFPGSALITRFRSFSAVFTSNLSFESLQLVLFSLLRR